MPNIYLSGPITNISYSEATNWRSMVTEAFKDYPDIKCFSPLRATKRLEGVTKIADVGGSGAIIQGDPFSTQRAVMRRDYDDCKNANLIMVNLVGATQISRGTIMEIAWGYALDIPILAVMEPSGCPHDYSMIREAIDYRAENLTMAIEMAKVILLCDTDLKI